MRHSWLHAVALTLSLGGSAGAQHGLLVRQDDGGDPCSRFKMRVLVPGDLAGRRLRQAGTAEGIDRKVVWDPWRQPVLQLALAPPSAPPGGGTTS